MLKELTMKLNVAAVLTLFLALAGLLVFSSGVAMALDGIDLSTPSEEIDDGGCSQLFRIKYPFLSCANGVIGSAEGDATWENSRQIPIGSAWVEGEGYWGLSFELE